jgi:hypothetical protein
LNKIDDKEILIQTKSYRFDWRTILRFDSDGLSHLNKTPVIPFKWAKVDTPHFHKFDDEGRNCLPNGFIKKILKFKYF